MSEDKETPEQKAERLYQEFMVTWKKSVQSDLDKHKNFTDRLFALVEILNAEEGLKVALIETPQLAFGPYTPRPRMVEIYLVYNLPKAVPTVPEEVRHRFLDLVTKLDKELKFPVYEYKVGFRPHVNAPIKQIVEPLLPDKCIHDCPMLKIVVAI